MSEFETRALARRVLGGWAWMAGLAVLGGLLGRLMGFALPPVYEARAEYYVGVDQSYFAHDPDPAGMAMTDFKAFLNEMSALALSDEVVAGVVVPAGEQGIALTADEFRAAARIDRYYTSWLLTVGDRDPQRAAALAGLWLAAFDQRVQQAYQYGLTYDGLRLEFLLLGDCFEAGDLAAGNACAGTTYATAEEFLAAYDGLAMRLEETRAESHGLTPDMNLRSEAEAQVPAAPARNLPATFVLAGAGLGFLAGLALAARRGGK